MPRTNDSTATKRSSLATALFYDAVNNYIDYNKPDPIAQRQLESWKMSWSEDNNDRGGQSSSSINIANDEKKAVDWRPKNAIEGTLEICGDYVAVTIRMECFWADGDSAENDDKTEDGRLSFTCNVISGRLIDKKDGEEKSERKIRKKMVARLGQDSYISKLLAGEDGAANATQQQQQFCLAQASIYVNATKFEMEERVDVSETVAETLRRSLWSSTPSPLDMVEVILAMPYLPCRSAGKKKTATKTTRLANRAKLRLLEDAMLDECEKEGEDQIIEDLNISNGTVPSKEDRNEQGSTDAPPTRKKKKSRR
mmetsp:Transcript_25006/g.54826  ORF Transcript_25006/g.54826 Transcript_25006/m.54826 type:complete len:311 (+) Transcript_25006:149-1081(+)|eukprot:CAMPEP_0168307112 /NCGR_PEP_ID=MMETSP0142_2-20121227/56533_1 /TAXON_ID=44445 /ORGANISM="Pseudo-nitzschia australis, Strain 10249 10 AB" /LENGTH=310 /DNA_ID=CAMNT_0008259075 /DNA_START=67 /DNA_END=1002 /DNA_ORIENTATION=+